MRGRTRNFLENIGVLVVFIGIIYGGYSLFFTNESQEETAQTIPIVTKEIKKESIKIEETVIEVKKTQTIEKKPKPKPKAIIANNTIDKKEQTQLINNFLRSTKNTINENIKQLLNIQTQSTNGYTKIRVTILKNGNFEQLKYMGGDKQYFESIKPAIVKIFPINMEEKIDDQFPRYFRMQINY
ncbi:MAG: hypothetical protein KAQ94_06535 [Arcobacteraceae bacterium]|nr:hypothetical protein [Arcobacteraceae bacterium]